MHEDTRQNPANRPELAETPPDPVETGIEIEDCVDELNGLIVQRAALENYRDLVATAGADGLDPTAKRLMLINLAQIKARSRSYGMESFDSDREEISVEDFGEWLSDLGQRIKDLIAKLIAVAEEYASKLMSGIEGVKTKAEELMDRIRRRKAAGPQKRVANELHDGDIIKVDAPAILWANGELCVGDCRGEQEVVKFFVQTWPRYAKEQITRAKKMISEYDVESGNSDNFESNIGFIGNHGSVVNYITRHVLPGNKSIAFKYVALGPELVDAEDATPAPAVVEYEIRPMVEITNALKANIATMNALGAMFKAESEVLHDMSTLSDALMGLENRRNETVWKSARDGLDDISRAMMELIGRLKPNYDPIVRHLAKVGTARNAVCQRELDALGQ